jgi:hypothetical protein
MGWEIGFSTNNPIALHQINFLEKCKQIEIFEPVNLGKNFWTSQSEIGWSNLFTKTVYSFPYAVAHSDFR